MPVDLTEFCTVLTIMQDGTAVRAAELHSSPSVDAVGPAKAKRRLHKMHARRLPRALRAHHIRYLHTKASESIHIICLP